MPYSQRYPPTGFVDLPSETTAIDSLFLNAVEAALMRLDGVAPGADGQVIQWIQSSSRYGPALIANKNVDPAAAIAWSKLNTTGQIFDADIANAANIARAKLNFGAGLTNNDIAPGANIAHSKLAGNLVQPQIIGPTLGGGSTTLAVAANVAKLASINVLTTTRLMKLGLTVTTSGGNIDLGVYYSDDGNVTFNKLVSLGSTPTTGTGGFTYTVPGAPVTMAPQIGRTWFLAFAATSSSLVVIGTGSGTTSFNYPQMGFSRAASFPLPATLSGMAFQQDLQPTLYGVAG